LPAEIANLADLRDLSLAANQFQDIPPEIADLSSLRFLSVVGNPLSDIPPELNIFNAQALIDYAKTPRTYLLQDITLWVIFAIGGLSLLMIFIHWRRHTGGEIR
jgi:Leucine-rich repeat (LRR) protein